MDVVLPSGNTVSFRDKMMRDDIITARRAMKFVTAPDGSRTIDGGFIDGVRSAIIRRMVVSWSFGPQVPGDAQSADLADRMLAQYLDEDDSLAMDMAVQRWTEKIISDPSAGRIKVAHESGERFDFADPEQAARLAAIPGFTMLEVADPKNGRKAIGTTSSGSPEQSGQTLTE